MINRSEKIIDLAKAMLHSGYLETPPAPRTAPMRALCVTALLAALSGSGVTACLQERSRPINRYERVEIKALLAYAARQNRISESLIQREMAMRLILPDLDAMTATDYARARDFLRDQIR